MQTRTEDIRRESPAARSMWNAPAETLSRKELAAMESPLLARQIRYACTSSPFYRTRFEETGVRPEEITDTSALCALPFMEKSEVTSAQQAGALFGPHQCAGLDAIVRVVGTGGTSGQPTRIGWTSRDIGSYNEMGARGLWTAGCRPGELVVNCFNYSLYAGGIMDHMTFEALGAATLPYGVGQSQRLLTMLSHLPVPDQESGRVHALYSTPSYALRLKEVAVSMGLDLASLGVSKGYFSGEAGLQIPGYRENIEEAWNMTARDLYGAAEFGVQSGECEYRCGLHYSGYGEVLAELVDPDTGAVLPFENGATGEFVFTTLNRQACPLIRMRTHDIVQVYTDPCRCGRKSFRFHVLGRSDDMFIVKGVNVFPLAIQQALSSHKPDVTGEFFVVLDHPPPFRRPKILLEVGRDRPAGEHAELALALIETLKQQCNFTASITLVRRGTIASEHKTRRLYRVYQGDTAPDTGAIYSTDY